MTASTTAHPRPWEVANRERRMQLIERKIAELPPITPSQRARLFDAVAKVAVDTSE